MKRIALATLLVIASSAIAAELPGPNFCLSVKGLDGRAACYPDVILGEFPLDLIEATFRNAVFGLGFDAANDSTATQRYREQGRKVMAAAPSLAFPEMGDPITKDTPAVAYCSSSVGNDVLDPFNSQNVKATGKGKCEDFMTVYLRPAGK